MRKPDYRTTGARGSGNEGGPGIYGLSEADGKWKLSRRGFLAATALAAAAASGCVCGKDNTSTISHSGDVSSVAFSPDGKTIASGSYDETIKLWDTATRALKTTIRDESPLECVAFSPDGKKLATLSWQSLKLWDPGTGDLLRTLSTGMESFCNVMVMFTPDGKSVVSSEMDRTVKFWDVATGEANKTITGLETHEDKIALSPDGGLLASGGSDNDGRIKLWDTGSGSLVKTFEGHENTIDPQSGMHITAGALAFNNTGSLLASGSRQDRAIKLWDVAAGSLRKSIDTDADNWGTDYLAYGPDGKTLAAIVGGSVYLIDASAGTAIMEPLGHSLIVKSVAFSPDGKTLASGSCDKTIKLWDIGEGKSVSTLVDPSVRS